MPRRRSRAFNGLRAHLPLLQALAANSPFWHGRDSGFATARAQLFRGFPRADIPRAFAGFDDYEEIVGRRLAAGALHDYTFLWWDIRPHPRLGTVEVRAMDAQSRLRWWPGWPRSCTRSPPACADGTAPSTPREALMESSLPRRPRRARGDDLARGSAASGARGRARGARARAPVRARAGLRGALEEIERVLRDGNGADRMRAAHAAGGMPAVLARLVEESAEPLYGYTSTTSPMRSQL